MQEKLDALVRTQAMQLFRQQGLHFTMQQVAEPLHISKKTIYSIKNTLYGTRDVNATAPAEHSLLNLLKAMNYSGLNDLTTALNNAIQALETAKNSGKSFVEAPGAQHVKDCIDAVSALDEELNKAGDWVNKQDAL